MSQSSLGLQNPLSYMGVASRNPPAIAIKSDAPATNDIDNFQIGSIWIDKTTDNVYMLVNKAEGIATWTFIGGALSSVETITTPDTAVVSPVNENINFLNGTGMAITGSGNDITFSVTSSPFKIQWNVVTGSSANLVIDEGVFANNAGGVTLTLPATAAVGDVIIVSSINAGGWTIAQNAGQTIHMGNTDSTTGVGGSIASSAIGDTVSLVCSVANNDFVVISSMGNIIIT